MRSIVKRIPDEANVGVTLSGGLDSSLITLITADHLNTSKKELIASSIFYNNQKENIDYEFAEMIASTRKNIRLIKTEISPDNFLDELEDVVRALGIQNSIRQLAMYKNYKTLKNQGIKVALAGEGADEFNWGYWHRFTGFKEDQVVGKFMVNFKESMIESGKYAEQLFSENIKSEININKISGYLIELFNGFKAGDLGVKVMGLYAIPFLGYLNKANDRLSMANSIETRFPFQDINLVQMCLKIPKSLQVNDHLEKLALRSAFSYILPKDIYMRRKSPLPAASNMEYHKKISEEFKKRLASVDSSFWELFNKKRWSLISKLYDKKINILLASYGDSEVAGGKLMLKRKLGESVDINDIRTNDIFKLLTTLVWYEQNLPFKCKL